jgi:asparagine synthetase B (glutamine-hydrolysing)
MSELLDLLTAAVAVQSRDSDVALLLSGGIDGLSVGLALQRAAKRVHAYTFQLEGQRSNTNGPSC